MSNIWVPKCKIVEARDPVLHKVRTAGFFKLDAVRPDGRRRPLTGWFPNLITNVGLNRMGTTTDYMAACRVGSGSAAPAFTDTNLQSHVAGTGTQFSLVRSVQSTPPYYAATTIVYRFAAGVAAGNLQEIGIATSATSGAGILFSRALILDSEGDPTTVTVLSDEVLDATYQLRLYPPLTDVVGVVSIGGVDYDYTLRARSVTDQSYWALPSHAGGGSFNDAAFGDGAIGAITAGPSGSGSFLIVTPAAYSDTSLIRQSSVTAGLTQANFAGGVDWAWVAFGGPGGNSVFGALQVGFTPAIPKDGTSTLTLVFSVAWARGSI